MCGANRKITHFTGEQQSQASKPSTCYRAENGGADRDQTDDLVVANDALYQLSYCPIKLEVQIWENHLPQVNTIFLSEPAI